MARRSCSTPALAAKARRRRTFAPADERDNRFRPTEGYFLNLTTDIAGLGGTVKYLDPAEAQRVLDSGENRSYDRPWELWRRESLGE